MKKDDLLRISPNSQNRKTPVLDFLFNKFAGTFKNRLQHRCFPVNFTIFLRTPTFQDIRKWLLLFVKEFICIKGNYVSFFC